MASPKIFSSLSKSEFEQRCKQTYEPFVIRGLASHWPLVSMHKGSESDAMEYLQANCLQKQMHLTRIPNDQNGRMFYSQDMRAMNFGTAQLAADDCFTRILQDTSDADYAIQSARVSEYFPALRAQMDNPLIDNKVEPLIWLGNRVIVAPHFDEADNIAVVVAGKRRFTLFPPEQVSNLYIGPLDHTPAGQAIGLVDVKTPDVDKHPRYAEAFVHGLSVELEPGDAIYIPTPWWHHVESLSPYNVLVNYWWSDRSVSTAMPYPMLLHAIQSLKTMDTAKQKAWFAIMQYYLFDEGVDPSAHIPEHARGILGELSPQLIRQLDGYIKQQLR
nr:cupin-like domain-containing protein [Glaciecola sp. XM2]